MRGLLEVVRHAARRLRRSPGYTWPVVASLALGIGLNTAIFAVTEGVLRRPLPYPDEARLVTVGQMPRRDTAAAAPAPTVRWELYGRDLEAWWKSSRTLASIATFSKDYGVVAGPAGAEFLEGGTGSPDLLRVLGVQPARGRWFAPDEGSARVVVLSHGLWQRQFAGDPDVIGRVLRLQMEPWSVIGVMPPGLWLPLNAEYWVPSRGMFGEQVVAPPRDGIPLAQVALELTALAPTVANRSVTEIVVVPLREQLSGSARAPMRLLFGAAALLLLIACANIANLSLARTLERQRELAVRLTLGASRRSLASLVLTESLMLAVLGATLGIVLATWGTRVVIALAPEDISRIQNVGLGATSVLFGGGVAILAALLVSIAPVLTATDRGVQPLLAQAGTRMSFGRTSRRVRYALVATQLAVALLLITGAGLLIRSVKRLTRGDHLGFSPNGVVIASVPLYGSDYRNADRRKRFVRDLAERVKALPGVQSVGFGPPPLVGGRGEGIREGFNMLFSHSDTTRAASPSTTVWVKYVDPGYLDAYGIRLRAGRAFQATDDSTAPRVAMLSAAAARLFFANREAIGQSLPLRALTRGGAQAPLVVGVVDDFLQRDLTMEANPEILLAIAQRPAPDVLPTLAVRSSGPTPPLLAALRRTLREIDPELAASRLEPMQAVVDASLSRHAFLLLLLGVFAGLGLVLSAIGLYAVISYLVTQRTLEIGIRMALGAQRRDVLALVLRESALLTFTGLAIGIPAALALTRFLTSFLFEVVPHDIATFAAAPATLAVIALIAALVPARRAAAVDPARAMRAD